MLSKEYFEKEINKLKEELKQLTYRDKDLPRANAITEEICELEHEMDYLGL